mgnify:CR=1 FL=1
MIITSIFNFCISRLDVMFCCWKILRKDEDIYSVKQNNLGQMYIVLRAVSNFVDT